MGTDNILSLKRKLEKFSELKEVLAECLEIIEDEYPDSRLESDEIYAGKVYQKGLKLLKEIDD